MKIWSLQVLRFWAALAVVVYHASNATFKTTHHFGVLGLNGAMFGRAGVDLFFVLSGLIITLTSRGLSAREFILRRGRRILPLYAGFTIFYLLESAFQGGPDWRLVVTSLTLWPALDRMVSPAVPVGWTLCFEVLFYASTAVVIWRPKLVWVLLAAFAAALTLRSNPVFRFVGNPQIFEFLFGVGLAFMPRWRPAIWLIAPALAATWFLGPTGYPPTLNVPDFLAGEMGWQRLLYLGVPAAAVVWGAMQIEGREGAMAKLGDASYALYLSHLPVVFTLVLVLCRYTTLPPDLIILTSAVASVLLSWRIHELFEKPVINWLRPSAPRAVPA